MKVRFFLRWYDLWIGAYWDRKSRVLYVCPLPMIGVALEFRRREPLSPELPMCAKCTKDDEIVTGYRATMLPCTRCGVHTLWRVDNPKKEIRL